MTKVKVASGAEYEDLGQVRALDYRDDSGHVFPFAQENALINSGFDFAQRQVPGTLTSVADDVYCADRWYALTQTAAIQYQRSTGSTAPYSGLIKQNQASAQRMGLAQIVEHNVSRYYRSRTVTFTFKAKASTATTIRYAILEWTGTADSVTSDVVLDWTSSTYTANAFFLAASLTVANVGSTSASTSYGSVSISATLSASCNNVIVFVWTEGTAAQNVTLELTEAIFGLASNDLTWRPRHATEEIMLCRRFYQKAYALDVAPLATTNNGRSILLGGPNPSAYYSVMTWLSPPMRITPTVTLADEVGNSGKIGVFSAGGAARTDNVTPSVGVAVVTQHNFDVLHLDANVTYCGFEYMWTAVAEL